MLKTLNKYEPTASIGVAIVLAGIDLRVAAVFLALRFVTACLALRRLVNGMIPVAKLEPRIVPRRPEPASPGTMRLGDVSQQGLIPIDAIRLNANQSRLGLAFKLGLDLSIPRDGSPVEYLIAGDQPKSKTGNVVARNKSI